MTLAKLEISVSALASALKRISIENKYHWHSPEVVAAYKRVDAAKREQLHRLVLEKLMDEFEIDSSQLKLPSEISHFYEIEFARIRGLLSDKKAYLFDWQNDLFAKDIGICSGRLIPVGPGLLEVSGVPRSLLFKNGVRQFVRLAYLLLFELKGQGPLLRPHVHLANVDTFNRAGWDRAYQVIGEILKMNPHVRGLMRSSWFLDPALSRISPHLSYLREVPVENGATIFYAGTEGSESGALSKSKSRRRLFDRGCYVPRVYYLVWPRQRLISYLKDSSGR